MPEFCTCGAQLPPDARFCHKCAKPQYDYPGLSESAEPSEPRLAPSTPLAPPAPLEITFHNRLAVRTGFVAALTAVILCMFPLPFPGVRLLIAFIAAGFLAVFLYSRRTGQVLSLRSGARIGWITGIFSFVLFSMVFTTTLLAISSQGGLAKAFRSQLPPNDARAQLVIQAVNDPASLVGLVVFVLIFLFVVLTGLPMLGGVLGAKVLAKE